jgi:heme a synthase
MTIRFRIYAWSVLAFHLAVILWGAFVRTSGSGAGCGEHWPLCNGQIVPHTVVSATLIEFSHRLTSGIALVSILALVAFAFRVFPRGHRVKRWALLSLGATLIECAIGAGLVLLRLVATDESLSRGLWLAAHLINTLFLLATLSLTAWQATDVQTRTVRDREMPPKPSFVTFSILGFLCAAILGGFAALAGTFTVSTSLADGLRADFSAASNIFVRLRILHPIVAVALGVWLLVFALQASASKPGKKAERRLAAAIATLVLCQFTLGFASIMLKTPAWLQLLHLLGADLLWIAGVLFAYELLPVCMPAVPSGLKGSEAHWVADSNNCARAGFQVSGTATTGTEVTVSELSLGEYRKHVSLLPRLPSITRSVRMDHCSAIDAGKHR